jgi:hypothetical protein
MRRLLALTVVIAFSLLVLGPVAGATQRGKSQSEKGKSQSEKIVEKVDLRPMIFKLLRERPRDGRHALHKAECGVVAFANIRNGQLESFEFENDRGEELPYEERPEETEAEDGDNEFPDPSPKPDDGCPQGTSPCTITIHHPDGSATIWFACC